MDQRADARREQSAFIELRMICPRISRWGNEDLIFPWFVRIVIVSGVSYVHFAAFHFAILSFGFRQGILRPLLRLLESLFAPAPEEIHPAPSSEPLDSKPSRTGVGAFLTQCARSATAHRNYNHVNKLHIRKSPPLFFARGPQSFASWGEQPFQREQLPPIH